MPTSKKDVALFFERLAILETKVAATMSYQKVQTSILVAILLMGLKALFK